MIRFDHEKLDVYQAAIDWVALANEQYQVGRDILLRIVSMLTKLVKM
jgi:hypothetical protein